MGSSKSAYPVRYRRFNREWRAETPIRSFRRQFAGPEAWLLGPSVRACNSQSAASSPPFRTLNRSSKLETPIRESEYPVRYRQFNREWRAETPIRSFRRQFAGPEAWLLGPSVRACNSQNAASSPSFRTLNRGLKLETPIRESERQSESVRHLRLGGDLLRLLRNNPSKGFYHSSKDAAVLAVSVGAGRRRLPPPLSKCPPRSQNELSLGDRLSFEQWPSHLACKGPGS